MVFRPERVWPVGAAARVGTVALRARIRIALFTLCTTLATASGAQADDRTFADLLARAKAQAAAGHRSTPPGDNMIETIAGMVDLSSTATPAQLEELVALLESDKSARPETGPVPPPPRLEPAPPAPSDAAASPTPPDTQPAPPAPSNAAASPAPSETQPAPPAPSDAAIVSPPSPANTSRTASLPAPLANPRSDAASTARPLPAVPPKPSADLIARAAALFTRGQAAEAKGDFSAARRLYGSAAEWGNAAAARSLGRLYDPAYIRLNAIGGVDPDPVLARSWYERAINMGDPNAGSLLNALSTR